MTQLKKMTYREAVRTALREALAGDPRVFLMGETVFGIIYPPQVALAGFGKVAERPWVVGGQIVARQTVTASLSADHRVSDGHHGGLFLAAVNRLLQAPEKL
jgi:pyruvate/2-oxoglutarate dehydrogenase complex dihydrolipoamide acyltransferase (E2) component